MTTGDDAERSGPASEPADGLPPTLPARSAETPPSAPPDLPEHTPSETFDGAPTLPPRPEGAPVAARLGPPPNAPVSTPSPDLIADDATPGHHEPDPEVIAALHNRAARLRRRNSVFQAMLALVLISAVAAAAYFGYRAYDRDQDDRQPPTTERPTSQELLDRLDGDD
jgi:hypothetical protein